MCVCLCVCACKRRRRRWYYLIAVTMLQGGPPMAGSRPLTEGGCVHPPQRRRERAASSASSFLRGATVMSCTCTWAVVVVYAVSEYGSAGLGLTGTVHGLGLGLSARGRSRKSSAGGLIGSSSCRLCLNSSRRYILTGHIAGHIQSCGTNTGHQREHQHHRPRPLLPGVEKPGRQGCMQAALHGIQGGGAQPRLAACISSCVPSKRRTASARRCPRRGP